MILGHSELPPLSFKRGEGFGYIHAETLLRPGVFDIYHPPIVYIDLAICRALAEHGEFLRARDLEMEYPPTRPPPYCLTEPFMCRSPACDCLKRWGP